MSRNLYYDDVKILKKPLKMRIKPYLIFFLIFLSFGGIVLSAMFISRSISVSNISSVLVYGGTDIKVNKRSVYALSMGKYSSNSEASKVAMGATIQGAGGYIWQDKDDYYVLGTVYGDKSSAESVLQNLSDSKYDTSVLEITMPKISISLEDLDNKSVSTVSKAISVFEECYDKLYGFSISFDKSEMNNLAISSYVSNMRGEIKSYISNIQSILSVPNAKIQSVQNSLIKLDELLDQTIIKTIDNSSTSPSLKYAICSLIRIEFDMRQNLG